MAENQKAKSEGGCGCSAKTPARPEAPVAKRGCCGGASGGHDYHHHAAAAVVDAVCGMSVDPETSKNRLDYRDVTYHFCSAGCRTKFEAAPQQYLDEKEGSTPTSRRRDFEGALDARR